MFYQIAIETHTLEDGSDFHVVSHPDLPGCHGFGSSFEEAMDRLALARRAYLNVLNDMDAPRPRSDIVFSFTEEPAIARVEGQQQAERAYIAT